MSGAGKVVVTAGDIAAARAAQVDMLIGGAQGDREVWRKVEQAFARHRIAAEAAQLDALREAREALEGIIPPRLIGESHDPYPEGKTTILMDWAWLKRARQALASLTAAIEGKG